jgi:anti-sigma regulatory factor (Ser/Thr protein kinase)
MRVHGATHKESRMPENPVEIRLIIPGGPEFLRLARLAAADAGSRAGLTYDEIEDLRIGTDELCHSVMRPDGTGVVTLIFRLVDDGIVVAGEGPPLDPDREAKPSELSRTIVAAVVDQHELGRDGDALRFQLFKRTHHR